MNDAKSVVIEERTLNRAIEIGLQQLQAEREQVQVEVLKEPVEPGEGFRVRLVLKEGENNDSGPAQPIFLKNDPRGFRAMQVTMSDDQMEAYLSLRPVPNFSNGNNHASQSPVVVAVRPADVMSELAALGVRAGIDDDAIRRSLQDYFTGRTIVNARIATGKPLRKAVEAVLHIHHDASRRSQEPPCGGSTVEDFRRAFIWIVQSGDLLATHVPGLAPEPGQTITGDPLEADRWTERKLSPGRNVIEQEGPDGSTRFTAGADGVAVLTGESIEVSDLQIIEGDVGPATGSIAAEGSLHIKGAILDGYSVEAAGTVFVDGEVGAATIRSGGHVGVAGGIRGGAKAEITTRGNFYARSIESARVMARGTVVVAERITDSLAVSGSSIFVAAPSGGIYGGEMIAADTVEAAEMGPSRRGALRVKAGRNCQLEYDAMQVQNDIDQAAKALAELVPPSTTYSPRKPMDPKLQTKVQNIENGKKVLERRQARLLKEAAVTGTGRIRARRALYPAVEVFLGSLHQMFEKKLESVLLYPEENENRIIVSEQPVG